MPRLPPSLVKKAHSINPLLPLLLKQTRTIELAESELRWLHEYAHEGVSSHGSQPDSTVPCSPLVKLRKFCYRRSLGEPLQYIVKSQPFGHIDIICKRGVLIPRTETEGAVITLCNAIKQNIKPQDWKGRELRVLDLCTGPGSIALLVAGMLNETGLNGHNLAQERGRYRTKVLGIDKSNTALKIARLSLDLNIKNKSLPEGIKDQIGFLRGDLLAQDKSQLLNTITAFYEPNHTSHQKREDKIDIDIIISNPPYISSDEYWTSTSRSVRIFEPELALVPPSRKTSAAHDVESNTPRQDRFFPHIESIASYFNAKAIITETGGDIQSSRVEAMFRDQKWETSTWKDYANINRNVVAWRNSTNWTWLSGMNY